MPQMDLCDITVILDRSGSMTSVRDETISGFNHFLTEQRKQPGEALMTLIQFDSQDPAEIVFAGISVHDAPLLTPEKYIPRGMTPLLDAVGRAIVSVGARFASLSEASRPERVLFMIVTDGQENASREFTKAKVKEMINHQQGTYKWEFIFLGANQDAFAEAGHLGVPLAGIINYAATPSGTRVAFAAAISTANRYRGGGQAIFGDEDRAANEEELRKAKAAPSREEPPDSNPTS